MQWLLYLLLSILAVLAYLLFAPFYIEIDSNNNLYRLRFHHLASGAVTLSDYRFKINLRIAWWRKQIDLFKKSDKKKSLETPAPVKKTGKRRPFTFSTIKAIIKSFKVNRFYLNVDSGDVELNGILYPVFYGVSRYTHRNININFLGENEVVIEIENNLAAMIWAYIYSSLKTKYHGKLR